MDMFDDLWSKSIAGYIARNTRGMESREKLDAARKWVGHGKQHGKRPYAQLKHNHKGEICLTVGDGRHRLFALRECGIDAVEICIVGDFDLMKKLNIRKKKT
jgi:hypothetical protein